MEHDQPNMDTDAGELDDDGEMYVPPQIEGVKWNLNIIPTQHGPNSDPVYPGRLTIVREEPSIKLRAHTNKVHVNDKAGTKTIAQVMPGEGLWWPHLPDECCGHHRAVWMYPDKNGDGQLLICTGCGLDCT